MIKPPISTTPQTSDSKIQEAVTRTATPPATTYVIPFELPQGLIKEPGQCYRQGWMRPATGEDELMAQQGAMMTDNFAFGILVRLSRVIALAPQPDLDPVSLSPEDIGNLFMPDLRYLLELYNSINPPDYGLSLVGESRAIPWNSYIRR